MTGDKSKFCLLIESDSGQVTFGGNSKGKIIGSRKVGKNLSSCIDDVILVEGLAYNLLSISQLCDKRLKYYLILKHVLSFNQIVKLSSLLQKE